MHKKRRNFNRINSNFKKNYSGYFLGNVCSSWATFNCTIWSRWLQVTLLVLAKVAHFSTFLGRLDGLTFQLPLTLFINNSASDVCPKWQSLLSFWKLFSAEITYSWLIPSVYAYEQCDQIFFNICPFIKKIIICTSA